MKIATVFLSLFITSAYSIRFFNIPHITAYCSKVVNALKIQGVDAYIPSDREARNKMKELGRALKIARIKDDVKREEKLDNHPELRLIVRKLEKLMELEKMSVEDQEVALQNDEEMLETVVRLSMLDTSNTMSPIYGESVEALLDDQDLSSLTQKYHQKDGMMRLMYSEVIPPGQQMRDSRKVTFTDDKGRTCYCIC